ncbi:MAG: hypothetical protein AB7M12_05060 [Hyphomonadaceae bacterium]
MASGEPPPPSRAPSPNDPSHAKTEALAPPEEEGPIETFGARLRRLFPSGVLLMAGSALVFAVSLWVIWQRLSAHEWAEILGAFKLIEAFNFWTAAALTVASYVLITYNDRLALRLIGREMKRRKHLAASVASYAIARTVGYAFFTAVVARMRLYAAAGLTAAETGRLSLYTGMMAQAGALAAAAIGLLGGAYDLRKYADIPRSISVGGAIALLIPVIVWLRNSAKGAVHAPANAQKLGDLIAHVAAAAFAWACAGAALYQLMPDHGGLHFPAFLACFVLATVVGALSGVPGGFGVFEATMLALATRDETRPSTAAALVMFRLIFNIGPLAFAAALLGLDQWKAARRAALRRRRRPPE